MISFIFPTHNRHSELDKTLAQLGSLDISSMPGPVGAEVLIVDNASSPPVQATGSPQNEMPFSVIRLEENHAAAARNIAAERASGDWLIMLDDDSYPLDAGLIEALADAPEGVAAIGAEILLPSGRREQGGLPEVIIGCGAAVRRDAFLAVGGYDPAFHYYAEEYDLCAKLIMRGWRVTHDRRFRVLHEKVPGGRSMDTILGRLVRNNGWVIQRYAPEESRDHDLSSMIDRYRRIAIKEHAVAGFEAGQQALERTLPEQPRTPMMENQYNRFTGLHHARQTLAKGLPRHACDVAIINAGKHVELIRQAIEKLGHSIVDDAGSAAIAVIGTLSPGPILDALDQWRDDGRRIVPPWMFESLETNEHTRSLTAEACRADQAPIVQSGST